MLGEINVHSSGGQQIGDPGMNWVEMESALISSG